MLKGVPMNDSPVVRSDAEAPDVAVVEDRRPSWFEGDEEEQPMGAKAGLVVMAVGGALQVYNVEHDIGYLFSSDCGYMIFPHAPRLTRYPDLSFVRKGRLPEGGPPDGNLRIVPDLVVEVISPNDLAEEVETRLTDFIRAGVPLIWVIYPNTRSIRVIRKGASEPVHFEDDELSGGEVLPGFSCRVGSLLTRKAPG
jgi:Uma2 family endonuclease